MRCHFPVRFCHKVTPGGTFADAPNFTLGPSQTINPRRSRSVPPKSGTRVPLFILHYSAFILPPEASRKAPPAPGLSAHPLGHPRSLGSRAARLAPFPSITSSTAPPASTERPVFWVVQKMPTAKLAAAYPPHWSPARKVPRCSSSRSAALPDSSSRSRRVTDRGPPQAVPPPEPRSERRPRETCSAPSSGRSTDSSCPIHFRRSSNRPSSMAPASACIPA